jgi:hypothetical protein
VFAEAADEVSGLRVHLLIGEDTARPTVLEVYGYDHARFPHWNACACFPSTAGSDPASGYLP